MNVVDLVKIARASDFQQRVEYMLTEKALAAHAGSPTTAESALIQKVLDGREPLLPWAIAVLTSATIAAGTHTLDGATIADADLRAQVGAQWPAFTV